VASYLEQERAFEHLREAFTAVGFLFGTRADSLMHAVRQLIGRALPSPQEVKILHGLARQLLYVAGKSAHPGEPV
jgi:tRNA/rRNA methyltransferase